MRSFRHPVTNILTAWGYVETNGEDIAQEESDDFSLEHGKWQWDGVQWVPSSPDPRIAIQAQIDEIERTTMVPRVTRELMLIVAVDLATRKAAEMTASGTPVTAEQILSANVGYQKTLLVEAQIEALRDQLWELR